MTPMRYSRILLLGSLAGLTLLLGHGDTQGQRGGGGRAAGARGGGALVGPYGGGGTASHARGTVVGPAGGAATAGASKGSYTTNRGTSIDYGKAGAAGIGPNGGAVGGGVGGVKVTGPNGQTAAKVGRAGGAVGPNGNGIAGGGSVAVGSGPNGSAASIKHGGVAVGPGGAVAGGSRVGGATGPGGTVVGGARGGVAVNPYGLSGYTTGRGVVAVGHRTQYVPVATIQTRGVYVRRSFVHYNVFAPNWYGAHPNAWRVPAWTAATIWRAATWATLSAACAYPVQPIVYDYGTTVVYQGDTVIVQGESMGTAAEYSQQAIDLAAYGQAAKPAEKDEWVPLGVFGMVQGDEKDANDIFQLAINKDGIIRGNYYNALSDTTVPVYGSVHKKTQRAAWVVGDKKDTVYETGIANLTEAETTMLVHFGKDRTQQWTLVRLDPPQDK